MNTEVKLIAELVESADHIDVKHITSSASMREFLAAAFGWRPLWLRGLFAARAVLAKAIRLDESIPPRTPALTPAGLDLTPGGKVEFFTVVAAEEDRYTVLEASDNHLAGYLIVQASPCGATETATENRYEVATVVQYRRLAGRFYFNLIRPFHHIVVWRMITAGSKA